MSNAALAPHVTPSGVSQKADAAEKIATKAVKSVFVIAASADAHCGVYDYTAKLTQAIADQGQATQLVALKDWSFSSLSALADQFRGLSDVALHVQYPSVAMGNSILPALLPLLLYPTPVYLTLHEFSVFSLPRKLIFWSYAKFAKAILFSNAFERDAFATFFKSTKAQLHVIPIGSNIDIALSNLPPLDQRPPKLVYFGQISENKGIEIFLETVAKLRAQQLTFKAAVIGALMDRQNALADEITRAAVQNDIELHFDLPSAEVTKELASARLALLPFPDGISDKRGSALACLNCGLVVATRHSSKTPEWLRQTTLPIDDAETCAAIAAKVLENPLEAPVDWARAAQELQKRQWPNIARDHLKLYESSSI